MNPDKEIKKLERRIEALKAKSHKMDAKRKRTALQKALAAVKKFGFDSLHELLEIADTAAVATSSKRKRARIDDAKRKSVIAMLKTGKTVVETAQMHKISSPSVNAIKAKAGLTKSRMKAKKLGPKKRTAKSKLTSRRIYGPKGVVPTEAAPAAKVE